MAYSERAPSSSDHVLGVDRSMSRLSMPHIDPSAQSSSMQMRILLTNDDGIDAPGLAALADVLADEFQARALELVYIGLLFLARNVRPN